MHVRPSTEEDWETLKEIRLAALLDSPTAFAVSYATAAAYPDTEWKARAATGSQPDYVIAFEGTRAIGLIGDVISPDGEYHLIAMWVRPAYRRSGVADALVSAIQARAVEQGHRRVVLSVSPENTSAVALYRRHGFVFLAETEPLASHPEIEVQTMEWRTDHP